MRKILILIIVCAFQRLHSQVIIQFVPEIHGRTVDGLMMAKFMSMSQEPQTAQLKVMVSERSTGLVVTLVSGPFSLYPGSNSLPRNSYSRSGLRFANNNAARMVRQSAQFPEGDYEYCYQVYKYNKVAATELISEQCFNYMLEPLTPLFLIEPYQKDRICERRPLFTWQPALPAIPGTQYRMSLAEIKEGQVITEALNTNIPLINQSAITAPMLLFPPSARSLEEGKKYVWQVTAYKGNTVLTRSEIWEFKVQCDSVLPKEPADGYRDIEDLVKGNFYVANGRILFTVINAYEDTKLQYSILSLNNPDTKIKNLPRIALRRGLNNISIDLTENRSFIDGNHYILTIELPNKVVRNLRFIYKSAQ
ncbi:MAG TPA: hypothetical protein VGD17_16495 [Chitinophagaceae bacterium]